MQFDLSNNGTGIISNDWAVGSGSSVSFINPALADEGLTALDVSSDVYQYLFSGSILTFTSGENSGVSRMVTSQFGGTLYLDSNLPNSPKEGDAFNLRIPPSIQFPTPGQNGTLSDASAGWLNGNQPMVQAWIAGTAVLDLQFNDTATDVTLTADVNAAPAPGASPVQPIQLNGGRPLTPGKRYIFFIPISNTAPGTSPVNLNIYQNQPCNGTKATWHIYFVSAQFMESEGEQGLDFIGTKHIAGPNTAIATATLTWAANAAADTEETASIPIPANVDKDSNYAISVLNPSGLGTSVTLKFQNQVKFPNSGLQYSEVTSVDVASDTIGTYTIQGWMLGDGNAQIVGTNDAAASANGGTVEIAIHAV